jgi:8-oxo-dGTP diphosphatase
LSQHLIEFACAVLIDTRGRFLLQQRDDVPGIYFPGRAGLFGGHRENGESFLQCVVREIYEELSYFIAPECFRHLVTFDGIVPSDGATARGEIFVADGIPADRLVVTEGSLLIVPRVELAKIEHKLTPSANFALTTLLGSEDR